MCCCCRDRIDCCDGKSSSRRRRFFTQEEKIERMKNYIEDLENELEAARERLDGLKSGEDVCCC